MLSPSIARKNRGILNKMLNPLRLTLIIALILTYQQGFAQTGVNSGSQSAQQQTASAANENYSKGRRDRNIGVALMASMFTIVPGTILVIKGINQMNQGKAQATAAGGSTASAKSSAYKGYDFEKSLYKNPADFQREIDQYKRDLEKFGYKYDDKTGGVTTPDGNTWTEDTFKGAADQVAYKAGISEEDAQKALDELERQKKLAKDNKKEIGKGDMQASNVGGGSAPTAPAVAPAFDPNSLFSSRSSARTIANARTTGLTKVIGGDTVGTSGDDIFQMVRRKYENKKSESFFLDSDWGL